MLQKLGHVVSAPARLSYTPFFIKIKTEVGLVKGEKSLSFQVVPCIHTSLYLGVGGAVALWLVCWTPDQAGRV